MIFLILVLGMPILGAGENLSLSPVTTVSEGNSDPSGDIQIPDVSVRTEPETFYEIKLVSPELLKIIQANAGVDDQILKIGPGMNIGVATPHVLYLRSDLQSDDYLLAHRIQGDKKNDILEHLLNILFGRDNPNTVLLHSDRDYMIWFDEEYASDDIKTVLAFAREFNNLSSTARFEEDSVLTGDLKNNYEQIPYYYYQIKITSRQFLDNYKKDHYKPASEEQLHDSGGTLVGFIAPGYVYLWDGLSEPERRYFLVKSLLWELGLHGETNAYPDSFFYKKVNSSAKLSQIDKEAISLLYGGRLSTNMTADSVRKALDISQ
ncbi:MAG: hypothetical protein LUQ50_09075 [Methanospirillum sp.]|uniref:hypothetical protein n=1 Tax=Methanospirillum sp. TaxID=45200 RepID=UPI00236EE6BB|nr:hypothetical protein [Methanospirillum sp.]MDD1729210.1 hypothetical protein [Methanospirillum sp.]